MTSTATIAPPRDATGAAIRWTPRLWGALILLCGVLFLDGLDVSMVGVALPSIRAQLGMSTSALQWVVSGYVLGYGGFLLLGGRAADLLGRRRVLLFALGVFAVASLLGGLVDDPGLLIAARFVKGMAAAFTAPAGLSIITTTFPEGPARNRALSIYTACGASGFSSGLILGGLMTEVGWRWTFLLPVPIALLVLVAGTRLIPHGGTADDGHRGYDVLGALLSTAALLILVFTVVSAPQAGWASVRTIGGLALAVVLGVGFVITERRVAHPLLRLGILRNRSVIAANIAAMVMFGSYVSFQFIGTMYMQSLLGWSPLVMALAFLPAGLLVAFGGPRTGALVNRFGSPRIVVAGLISLFAGYALFLRVGVVPDYPVMILPSMLLLGLGFALAFPALNIQATNGVADDEQGLASGLVQTAFQVGGAITLAVVTAVISASTTGTRPAQVLAGYHPGLVLVTCVALAGVLATLALSGLRGRRAEAPVVELAD
ncbi:MAG TPA: MFS transporter [Pseudonocardiaceae bacterium]|nr:MFS transporter [Pseudonocardiaceae bacterium]